MSKPIRQVIAENLKTLIDRKDISANALAQKAGVSHTQIGNILNQTTAVKVETLESIAKALHVSVRMLMIRPPDGLTLGEWLDKPYKDDENRPPRRLIGPAVTFRYGETERDDFAVRTFGTGPEVLAFRVIAQAFADMDDEGKAALLRHALAEAGKVPSLVGAKLPRDWRELARTVTGLEEPEKPEDFGPGQIPADKVEKYQAQKARGGGHHVKVKAKKLPKKVGSRKKVAAKKRA